jgi:hypothetical protein
LGSDYFPSEVCRHLITVESIESVEVIVVGAVSLSIGGIRITESSSVGSVSREGVVVAQVLGISLGFSLSLSFPLEDTTVVEVVEVRAVSVSSGVRISSVSSGVWISSSVGSVSREGVVVVEVLGISLRFSLSLSFSLKDTTVVEVVEVRAVSVCSGVRISSISSSVRISSVSRIGVVVKLSISLGFSLSLTFTQTVMDSGVSVRIDMRLIYMIEGVDGIGVCWGLNLDLFGQVVSERHGRDVRVDYFFWGSVIESGVFGSMMLEFGSFDAVGILRNDSSIVMLDKSSSEMLSLRFGNNRKDKEGSKNKELHS